MAFTDRLDGHQFVGSALVFTALVAGGAAAVSAQDNGLYGQPSEFNHVAAIAFAIWLIWHIMRKRKK